MKKQIIQLLIVSLLLGYNNIIAQVVTLDRVEQLGGGIGFNTNNFGESIAVDAYGNVYATGFFNGTADFDNSSGVTNLISAGNEDIYIYKFDIVGTFLWAKSIGGTGSDIGKSIAIDDDGNVYITGYFNGVVDFDPNVGIFNLTSVGGNDIFVLKLDSSGAFVWAKNIGGTGADVGNDIAVDANGNVYTTGEFHNTVDFDPNAGIFNLTSVGGNDIFVLKLDSSGAFVWAKNIGGTNGDIGYSIAVDAAGNVYTTGEFRNTADFDPGIGVANLTSAGISDAFISKLDASGAFLWVKQMSGTNYGSAYSIAVDDIGNIYTTGFFYSTVDFDPGVGVANLTSAGNDDAFVSKLDASGAFLWAKRIGGTNTQVGNSITIDAHGNIYTTGYFDSSVEFDSGAGGTNITRIGIGLNTYIAKLDASGTFQWAEVMGGSTSSGCRGNAIAVDASQNVYVTGFFYGTVDFDPGIGVSNLTAVNTADIYIVKLNQKNIIGHTYQDFNQNCNRDSSDLDLSNRVLIIQPGNIIVQTNSSGIWTVDSLPVGNYTITVDTSSNNWLITCPVTQNFTVIRTDSLTTVPSFGFISTTPCPTPNISIHAPVLRPGFSNQFVYVQVCNEYTGTNLMDSVYIIVELDSLLTVQSGSLPYTNLGNNQYQIAINTTIFPGLCVDFWLNTTLSANAILGQTLCMNAALFPIDSCALDNDPNPYPLNTIAPCTLPWDRSSLQVTSSCQNDSVRFVIYNTGSPINGNMNCFAPVRIYLDGQAIILDSIQLAGGDSIVFMFEGNGQTWRLEADQHPLHPGNSHPNTTIENCGFGTWTPNLVNTLPHDDADPITDIFCGLVRGSYDPNDKTGYPLGVGTTHDILPNQDIEYLIRFQNTGTDTAFTVVIRDTLSTDLDIFSVTPGVSSHDYSFKMYGPRVLEWTFSNIMLPDSNINEPASNGFATFKVRQMPNLANGTIIQNSASIYFDFNTPIFTNQTQHTINDQIQIISSISQNTVPNVLNFLKAFPNPAVSEINIEFAPLTEDAEITLFNVLGQNLYTSKIIRGEKSHKIYLSGQFSGVHFIQIAVKNNIQTAKIIIE
jgi:uncharacterized repeat protein (TIGR01451 family)